MFSEHEMDFDSDLRSSPLTPLSAYHRIISDTSPNTSHELNFHSISENDFSFPSESSSPEIPPINSNETDSSPSFYEHTQDLSLAFSSELLYANAPITKKESWNAIMEFAIHNNLTYKAVEKLIQLLRLHCPTPNHLPSSFYKLKKYYQKQQQKIVRKQYCSVCNRELPFGNERCSNKECRKNMAEVSHLYITDFEKSLVNICEGM